MKALNTQEISFVSGGGKDCGVPACGGGDVGGGLLINAGKVVIGIGVGGGGVSVGGKLVAAWGAFFGGLFGAKC